MSMQSQNGSLPRGIPSLDDLPSPLVVEEKSTQPEIEVTEEMAAKYEGAGKGRIPTAISKQVVAINRDKRLKLLKQGKYGIIQQPKIDAFLEEFLKNGGNATKAAMAVYNCTTIASAQSLGHATLKRAKGLARIYLESQGTTYGKLLDIAAQKVLESKSPDWWDRLMKISDYEDFMTKKSGPLTNVNVFQAHKDFASDYVDGEIEEVKEVEEQT